ncbi:nitric oxide synthase oxygenase [Micromonospora sp. WMMC273]|uniref:nitric oxide synthase oxygenase n=1 Tax=Micromonospora sp. WMMC273 TaxID=3015157 RepID=UPI0022B6ECBE|nr:nitric oxide synthase oxygenase [Micromonospora sp. WMMC273]MCZ7478906.1 nitric oxide synthase oxygenase [Micromonospora sp. WMMC273]
MLFTHRRPAAVPASPPPPATCPVDHTALRPSAPPPPVDREAEARQFLELFHTETGRPGLDARWQQVSRELDATGTWLPTTDELTHGARVAWRQSSRCIGRLRWQGLVVRDLRHVRDAAGIHRELVQHLEYATNRGRIRSVISVFAPDSPDTGPRARVWNDQLVRYAGWKTSQEQTLGDARYLEFTRLAISMGWQGPRGRTGARTAFDLLPWIIETDGEQPQVFPVPPKAVREVKLTHPRYGWFASLGLRWHAVPVISNMRLSFGGLDFSCAPFNGFYLGAEIATRNLADPDRYNLLPVVAELADFDVATDPLWRDKALLVLQEAVLHSFTDSRTSIVDHHTESERFAAFVAREERAGRPAYGDWSWLNPYPMTPQDPSWQRYYADGEPSPNFYLDDAAAEVVRSGLPPARSLLRAG